MSTENFYFENFVGDYYLTRDDEGVSHLKVSQKMTTVFPEFKQNKGICLELPFTNQDGKNVTLPSLTRSKINVLRNGEPEPIYSIDRYSSYYEVCTGTDEYVLGRQEYTFEYEYEKVITDYENYQELYWDTNGNGWTQKFNSVTARVHLAEDLQNSFSGEAWCYVGKYGESGEDRCEITKTNDGMEFVANNLAAHENLTFDMEMAAGTFELDYQPVEDYGFVIAFLVVLILCGVCLIKPIMKFRKILPKKKFDQGLFVKPEYQPEDKYTLSEMAENYMGDKRDYKVGMLLDLVVRKKIAIIKEEHKKWSLKVLDMAGLEPDEIKLLRILDGGGEVKTGDEIKIRAYVSDGELRSLMSSLKWDVANRIERDGLQKKGKAFKKKNVANIGLKIMLWVFGFYGIAIFFSVADELSSDSLVTIFGDSRPRIMMYALECVALIVIVIIATLVTAVLLKRQYKKYEPYTEAGIRASKYMDGLKLYIKMAEAERLKFLQSVEGADVSPQGIVKLYEKLLPYAAVFGLENSWAKELQKYCEVQEITDYTFNNVAVIEAVSMARTSAAIAVTSTTIASSSSAGGSGGGFSSSSSSGGGGGGFSGGGGGGGGGHGR